MRILSQLLFSTTLAIVLCLSISAQADVVLFSGADPGAGPVAGQNNRPNSALAASQFATAAANAVPFGFVNTVDFENIPLSTPNMAITNQVIVPGQMSLTLTGTSLSSGGSAIYGISNTPNDVSTGYNTTLGGSKHLKIAPQINVGTATVRFDFSQANSSILPLSPKRTTALPSYRC